jgi:hypothetical protein
VLRYQDGGFEGSGGWLGNLQKWPLSDRKSTNFGILNQWANGLEWTITSRASRIPNTGNGNIPAQFAGTGSANRNQLWYFDNESFQLWIDTTTIPKNFYTGDTSTQRFGWSAIMGALRLPEGIFNNFWGGIPAQLCETTCDDDGDTLTDDLVVYRSVKWNVNGSQFAINPSSSVFYNLSPAVVNPTNDTSIRKSTLNDGGMNLVYSISYDPVATTTTYPPASTTGHNLIWSDQSIATNTFSQIFQNINVTGLELNLSLLNLLKTNNGQVYPFLEYYIDLWGNQISDRFFTIQGKGKAWQYEVRIINTKPVIDQKSVSDFTIIF